MFGLGFSIAVLLDATVVRMMIVPAVMALFGDRAWALPRWLDRALPDLDVEGQHLIEELDEVEDGAPDDESEPADRELVGV
jgi:putative drug exporter of the RND superfamily